jgi:type IV pilus assembly protein PilB
METPQDVDHDDRTGRRRRLGELLVDAGVLSEAQLDDVLSVAPHSERLGATVMRLGLATDVEVADALATQLRFERIDLEAERPDPAAIELLPPRLAQRHEVLPVRLEDGVLVLATADPTDLVALDDVRLATGVRTVRPIIATVRQLATARRRAYAADAAQDLLDDLGEPEGPPEEEALAAGPDQPVVKLVDAVLADAVASRASDVHLEPDPDGLRVRVRVDGLLRDRTRIPRSMAGQVVSRLKIVARLDIAERRLPQDGRTVVRVEDQELDVRVSTMPTLHGETVVLRLLPKGTDRVAIDDLGLQALARTRLLDALQRPQGLVLVTGPTGSGKTTTLYAGLAAVTDPTRNVLTLEDPVEVQLPGVNQTQVEPKIGLTFARGLRHVLRQDPDVVLVGEIRDQETAQLAVEASFTGHLVLATLHTNDAPSSLARLTDLGADRFLVASSLLLVVAQRLARRVCPRCAEPDAPDPGTAQRLGLSEDQLASASPRRGAGCSTCEGTGTLGRIAVTEVLGVTPRLRELILEGAAESTLARQARRDGLTSLREDALDRALAGDIPLEEALRVTPEPSGVLANCAGCGARVGDDHLVCPWCGEPLGAQHCRDCGRAVEEGWRTCPWCRHPLEEAAVEEPGAAAGTPTPTT